MTGTLTLKPASGNGLVQVKGSLYGDDLRCQLTIGSDGTQGIWSSGYWDGSNYVADGKFMLSRSTSNAIQVNGNALTATTAANAINAGKAVYASSYLASRGNVSGSNHAAALKAFFDSNKSSIPRNCWITHYSSAYSNGSQCAGYWLSGYNDGPYGGFFVCHYNNARYVGIQNGTYTEYDLTKTTSSSIRIKTNIKNLEEAEAKQLLKITPIKFDYKESYGEKNQFGFIAEELEEKFPYAVYCPNYDKEKEEKPLQSIDYTKLIPHLIKLVQIQNKEIEQLKQEIKELKGK